MDEVVDFTREAVGERIVDLTEEAGVDSAIEASGAAITCQQAVKVTKPGGPISNVGYHGESEFVHIPRVDPTWMRTHRFPFAVTDRAFEIMDKKLDGVVKPPIEF